MIKKLLDRSNVILKPNVATMYGLYNMLILVWAIILLWLGSPTNCLEMGKVGILVIWRPIWWIGWSLTWLPKTKEVKHLDQYHQDLQVGNPHPELEHPIAL